MRFRYQDPTHYRIAITGADAGIPRFTIASFSEDLRYIFWGK